MYILFGTKWAKLYGGPILSYAPIMQSSGRATDEEEHGALHPTKVGHHIHFWSLISLFVYM